MLGILNVAEFRLLAAIIHRPRPSPSSVEFHTISILHMSTSPIVQTKGLAKTYAMRRGRGQATAVEAVKGVDLIIEAEEIFGFLGPNGAGKTTALRMLTTLLAPTAGQANVVGFDLHSQPEQIRKRIGYVSQAGGTDTSATAWENLILQARLYGIGGDAALQRTRYLIERMQMGDFAQRPAMTYSGGQRRRLDLALGMVHKPPLLFLDEPTLGLDPQSRAYYWDEIQRLRAEGTTVFLTTHYMDEADKLCDRVSIIDHGVIVAEGTPDQLKKEIRGDSILLGFANDQLLAKGRLVLSDQPYVREDLVMDGRLHLYVEHGEQDLPAIIRLLDAQQVAVTTIEFARPSLDDVFLQKTGRSLRDNESE
jgi:ABC-2 type transport system ATP-binding protein